MSFKRWIAACAFLALLGLVFSHLNYNLENAGGELTAAPRETQALRSAGDIHVSPSPRTEAASLPVLARVDHPPSVADLRAEVAHNVHETPPSLLRFGAEIGERMKLARKSEAEAGALLDELKTCAIPEKIEESAIQTRALCLVTARELEGIWPGLHSAADELVSHADPAAVQLAGRLDSFSEKREH